LATTHYALAHLVERVSINMGRRRWMATPLTLLVVAAGILGAPDALAQSPYPDIKAYRDAGSLEKFKLYTSDGVWFTTPLGLYCSIGDDSSFGCSGAIPGTLAGENEVAWFPGDPFPRLYYTDDPRFNSGLNQQLLASSTKLTYRGTTCGITVESAVYCINGDDPNSQVMVKSHMTYRGADGLAAS
jgi:hypothetical protein